MERGRIPGQPGLEKLGSRSGDGRSASRRSGVLNAGAGLRVSEGRGIELGGVSGWRAGIVVAAAVQQVGGE